MKINDIVYVAYKGGMPVVLQVKLMTEFTKSKRSYIKGLVCQAKFIKKYNLKDGWHPYQTQTHRLSSDTIYSVEQRNIYASWEEALEILQKLYLGRVERQQGNIDYCKARIQEEQGLEQENYISPFTNQEK